MEYAGFWRRLGAMLVDGLILLPVGMAVVYYGFPSSQLFMAWWLVPAAGLNVFYNIYLVTRWGGTPGLLLFKLRIRMLDNTPVTLKAAAIRYSVILTLGIVITIGSLIGILRIDETTYFSMAAPQIATELTRLQPAWARLAIVLTHIWLYGELIILLFNKKRRGQQDFMAGTVVLMAQSLAAKKAPLANQAPFKP